LLQGWKRSRIKEVLIQDLDKCFIAEFVLSSYCLQGVRLKFPGQGNRKILPFFCHSIIDKMDDMTSSTLHLDDVWKSLSNSIRWTSRKPNKTDLSKFVVSLPLSYVVEKCYRYIPLCFLGECFVEQNHQKKTVPFPFQVLFSPTAMSTKLWTNFYAKNISLM